MKRFICVLLAVALLLSFTGCAFTKRVLTQFNTEEFSDVAVLSTASNSKYTAAIFSDYLDQGGDGEVEDIKQQSYIALFKNSSGKLVKKVQYDDAFNYTIALQGEEVHLQPYGNDKELIFDLNLEKVNERQFKFVEDWKRAEKISALDISRVTSYSTFAVSYDSTNYTSLMFYDTPDTFYIYSGETNFDYVASAGHRVLTTNWTSDGKLTGELKVVDYDYNRTFSELQLDDTEKENYVQCCYFTDSTVTFATIDDKNMFSHLYLWNYTGGEGAKDWGKDKLSKVAVDELEAKTKAIADGIFDDYGVIVEVAAEEDFFGYESDNDMKPINFYITALDIRDRIHTLPKEFYKELLCKDVPSASAEFEQFRIYLVGNISGGDGTVSAYASNIFLDDDTPIIYIVYACTSFNSLTFYHELMHTMEYRIWNSEPYFDDKWQALNPAGFEYQEDYSDYFYSHEDQQEYFEGDYGMKSELEDRATCFATLCDGVLFDNAWWTDKKPLFKKIKYLNKVLNKTYPSLKKDNFWSSTLEKL